LAATLWFAALIGCTRGPLPVNYQRSVQEAGETEGGRETWTGRRAETARPDREAEGADGHPEELTGVPIAIDGRFEDWAKVPPAFQDPAGDFGPTGIDLTDIKVSNDEENLYLLVEVGTELELDYGHQLTLYIDCDADVSTGSPRHGFGAEIVWAMGTRSGRFVAGGSEESFSYAAIGFRAAPTTTSPRFEMALDRHLMAANGGLSCAGGTIHLALADDTKSRSGRLVPDSVPPMTYSYSPLPVPDLPPVTLEKRAGEAVRVLTWNVLWSGILETGREEHFRRVLQALKPDIVNLQEIIEFEEAAARVEEWLPLESGQWLYLGFGDRVTISRHPIVWDWPATYAPLTKKITVVPVEVEPGKRIVFFNGHLSFGSHDEERQLEADSFIAYVWELMTPGGAEEMAQGTPFMLLGDLNLVGDAGQLETLLTGSVVNTGEYGSPHPPDWDGTDLAELWPRQTGSRMGFTWRDDKGSFWPGKLDFIIYSDSRLAVDRSFVLDTSRMTAEELEAAGLEAEDTGSASDHLPVVADFLFLF